MREITTWFEEVNPCFIAPDVKIFIQQTALFETKLSEIISTVISEDDKPSWFQYLNDGGRRRVPRV